MIQKLQEEIVLGPIDHPQFGRTLIVRPGIGTQRQGRLPSQAIVITAAARRLIEINRDGGKLQAVVVEGGEYDPTTHPEFHAISENLRELANKHFPKAKLVLLSASPDLDRPQARHAVTFYDHPILRLDAGTQKVFQALTGEPGEVLKTRVASMARLETERLIVEAQFQKGPVDNASDSEVRHWLKHLDAIRPSKVHIRAAERRENDKTLKPVPSQRLGQIAELVSEKIGVPVEVLAG